MWCYDKATAFPAVVEGAAHYDLFYVFESSDVPELGEHGVNVTFLPMGYDPTYYNELDEDETIDVSFVGSLNDRRKRLLERVVTELPDVNLQIWGNNWSWYDPFAQFEYRLRRRKLGNCIHNHNLPAASVNEVYNQSKICVNIHGPHSKRAMNPRTFEILGSGAFELVDYKPRLFEQLDIGKEILTYETADEFVEMIDYYLDDRVKRNEIAARGHQRAQTDHTYSDRLQRILADYHEQL
jgi:spore maturation protein CgeB